MIFAFVLFAGLLGLGLGYKVGLKESSQHGIDVTLASFGIAAAKLDLVPELKRMLEYAPTIPREHLKAAMEVIREDRHADRSK